MIDEANEKEVIDSNYIKAKAFFSRKIPVHISLKDRTFLNGSICEIENDLMVLEERKFGKKLVFFMEIFNIEEMMEDKKLCSKMKESFR